MKITEEELSLVKKHCKVDISYDDDLLEMYYEWATLDIIGSVTDLSDYDESFFNESRLFRLALFPLVAYYYENRVAYTDRKLTYAPQMVLSVIHKLRHEYDSHIGGA